MKKSLLAVAAMTAFAGAAQAQSSVSVYGILDVGYVGSTYNGTAVSVNASGTNNVAQVGSVSQKQTMNAIGQSAESTSRLGFKGSEDLGGGNSAIFTLETAISPDGSVQGFTFNRQAFVGLKKNGLGATTIGTQYTPLFNAQSITDAAGNNNLVGNAVYSGALQSSTGTYNQGQGPYAGPVPGNANISATAGQNLNASNGAYTTRVSNAVLFQTERMAGLQGGLMYAQSNDNLSQSGLAYAANAGGVNNNTLLGANLDYVWNKLQVVAATMTIKNQDIGGTTANTAANATIAGGTAASFGTNMIDNQTYAAATYDFGILKAYGQYITRKTTSVIDASQYGSRSAYQLGLRSQLTPVISAYATMGLGKSSYYGSNNGINNFRTFQIGSDYNLSKRTNLYVAYGAFNQSSNGNVNNVVTTTAAQGAAAVGVSGANYAVGVRHTF